MNLTRKTMAMRNLKFGINPRPEWLPDHYRMQFNPDEWTIITNDNNDEFLICDEGLHLIERKEIEGHTDGAKHIHLVGALIPHNTL